MLGTTLIMTALALFSATHVAYLMLDRPRLLIGGSIVAFTVGIVGLVLAT